MMSLFALKNKNIKAVAVMPSQLFEDKSNTNDMKMDDLHLYDMLVAM